LKTDRVAILILIDLYSKLNWFLEIKTATVVIFESLYTTTPVPTISTSLVKMCNQVLRWRLVLEYGGTERLRSTFSVWLKWSGVVLQKRIFPLDMQATGYKKKIGQT
jgi:hypothetical protein